MNAKAYLTSVDNDSTISIRCSREPVSNKYPPAEPGVYLIAIKSFAGLWRSSFVVLKTAETHGETGIDFACLIKRFRVDIHTFWI
jgi:hypothetical protein